MDIENNKLIVEFLGYKMRDNYVLDFKQPNKELLLHLHYESLPFSSDWNYLMEVVEKIDGLPDKNSNKWATKRFKVVICGCCVDVFDFYYVDHPRTVATSCEKTSFLATYNACVRFINWYNKQNK